VDGGHQFAIRLIAPAMSLLWSLTGDARIAIIVGVAGYNYNRGRPHSPLGPGLPEPNQATVPEGPHRYELPSGYRIIKTPVLGALHHDYRLEQEVA
jgi:hypothetical protein